MWDAITDVANAAAEVGRAVNDNWRVFLNPPRDPLAIDLDRDGIETIGLPTLANSFAPVLFDHNADGIRTGTGWVKPDDAWLVLDRNGNGVIDSGRELFGVDTLVTETKTAYSIHGEYTVTTTRNAFSGFDALRTLDANADGVFNASDAEFANVRLWQDANQDGVSQAGELKTLSSAGITGISLTPTSTNLNLGNGNTVTGQAVVTRSGGSTTTVGSVSLGEDANDLNLADNPFYRVFNDSIPLTEAAKALPGMQGSGWVRDLQEAASLANPAATALEGQLSAFAAATTRDAQQALLDSVLEQWARTTGRVGGVAFADLGIYYQPIATQLVSQVGSEQTWRTTAIDPALWGDPNTSVVPVASLVLPDRFYEPDVYVPESGTYRKGALTPEGRAVFDRMALLEVFNGSRLVNFTRTVTEGSGGGAGTGGGGGGAAAPTRGYDPRIEVNLMGIQVDRVNLAYEALRESVYSALALQTRLKPYLDSVNLVIDETGVRFDTSALTTRLETYKTLDPRNALIDLLELNQHAQLTLQAVGFDGLTLLRTWVDALPADSALGAEIKSLGLFFAASGDLRGSVRNDIYLGNELANTFDAGDGDDALVGGAGKDNLSGGNGDDVLRGDAGTDTLNGQNGNDYLQGGADDDYLWGNSGHDTLDGGSGIDRLYGGDGADLYLFNIGSGADILNNIDHEALGVNADTIRFGEGIDPTAVTLTRSSDDLLIKVNGTTDSLQVQSYFRNDGTTSSAVENIQFADGTVWTIDTVKALALQGSSGNDRLTGYATDDTIHADAGADTLYGQNGHDSLHGGADNDQLWGGAGDDTLDGGTGSDQLNGGDGADVYLFNIGSGSDTITNGDNDALGANADTVRLGEGIDPTGVMLTRSGDNLIITINGTTDRLQVQSYFMNDGTTTAAVEHLQFADGTTWDIATVKAKVLEGTAGNDVLTGFTTADTINAGAGNDLIYAGDGDDVVRGEDGGDTLHGQNGHDHLQGGAGDDYLWGNSGHDTLEGGSGIDRLYGGDGADVYVFNIGSGSDTISNGDNDALGVNADTIRFGEGIDPTAVTLTRSSDELLIKINGTTDSLQVQSYFRNDGTTSSAVENIQFADGTVWTIDTVKALALQGSSGNDRLTGYATDDLISGGAGNDTMWGRAGHDRLMGEGDNDQLYGEAGNDTLNGGAGNDSLWGGTGNDVYEFGRGSGADVIQDVDTTAGNTDVMQLLTGIMNDQVWLRRVGSSLEVSIIGTGDKATVSNWYSGTEHRLEQIKTSSGQTLLESKVNALVEAMAAFAPPAPGQTTLPTSYQSALNGVIAESWQP